MVKRPNDPQKGEVIEHLTLIELCRIGGFSAEWVIELVDYGVLEPSGAEISAWRFEAASAGTAARAWRLRRDLGVNLPGIAIVIGLIEERDHLKRRLGRYDPFD